MPLTQSAPGQMSNAMFHVEANHEARPERGSMRLMQLPPKPFLLSRII